MHAAAHNGTSGYSTRRSANTRAANTAAGRANKWILANAQALVSQFNAADIIWIVGAVILAVLAIKVVAKILKFVLIVGAVLLVLGLYFPPGFCLSR